MAAARSVALKLVLDKLRCRMQPNQAFIALSAESIFATRPVPLSLRAVQALSCSDGGAKLRNELPQIAGLAASSSRDGLGVTACGVVNNGRPLLYILVQSKDLSAAVANTWWCNGKAARVCIDGQHGFGHISSNLQIVFVTYVNADTEKGVTTAALITDGASEKDYDIIMKAESRSLRCAKGAAMTRLQLREKMATMADGEVPLYGSIDHYLGEPQQCFFHVLKVRFMNCHAVSVLWFAI